MDRLHDILNSVNEVVVDAAKKTYKGQKRSDLKNSDFLFPQNRSFPIVTPRDIPDAINNFGRMKGQMTYDAFLKKLYNMAKRKGPEFVAALPDASKEKLGIKKSQAGMPFNMGDKVININSACMHYGSKGRVCGFEQLPDQMGEIVVYKTTNEGNNWKAGDILKKTASQLSLDYQTEDDDDDYYDYDSLISNDEEEETDDEENNDEEMNGYKQSYYDMSVGSLRAIMNHAKDILDYLDSPMVKENLTAPHLQGMIAVAEDHLRSIHDFVMFVETDDEDYEESESEVKPVENMTKKRKKVKISDLPHYEYQYKKYPGVTTTMGENNRPGLWENIRKKKEREGKKYRPAQPGDKQRPDTEMWKKLTK
jgi:hypothetical protein